MSPAGSAAARSSIQPAESDLARNQMADEPWDDVLATLDAPFAKKATCPQCAHTAPLGSIYCLQCGATLDNAPLDYTRLRGAEQRAKELLFADLNLVLRPNPTQHTFLRGTKKEHDVVSWLDRCYSHWKHAVKTPRPDNPRLMCTSIADPWICDKQYRINIEH